MYMYDLVIINSDALLEGRCQLMFSRPLFMGLSVHASIIVIHFYLGSPKARLSPVQCVLNASAEPWKPNHGAAPGYLRDYCKETHSSASGLRLRSTDKCHLLVRRMKTQFGDRAFSAAGPRCWNNLPAALRRAADSIDSFKTGLKTYLFSNAYSAVS